MRETPLLDTKVITAIERNVKNIAAFDKTEKTHQQEVIAWLKSGANPFRIKKPDVPLKHLVSYFVLVDPDHRSVLLIDHIKAQLWLPTGGHVRLNESPRDAVIREAQEELNIQAVFLYNNEQPFFVTSTVTAGLTPGHTDISLWYLLRGRVHDFLHYDKAEFNDTEWYTFDEVLESDPVIFDPHLQRFVRKLAQYLSAQ
jgi:8-oxo-dGTP diphosphatase